MSITEGSAAPDFTMDTNDGEVRLADYRGKRLVLYFYPKDNTSGCTTEALQFTEMKPEFDKAGVEILGVSKDSIAQHEKFIAKHDLGIRLGSDPEGKTIEAYGSWVEKNMYGRKYMGIERSTFLIGPDGKIEHVWRKVRVKGHVENVLKRIAELG